LQPDIIVTGTTPATVALQRDTRTIPIVFASVSDPVAGGIVERLDRPSGNVTGFANYEAPLGGKWLELFSEIAPGLKRAAIMGRGRQSSVDPAITISSWPPDLHVWRKPPWSPRSPLQ
jgi:putative ABC transport system substrate-binding protein